MNLKTAILNRIMMVAVLMTVFIVPVEAHHSFAMFDKSKSVSTEAVVKRVDWRNPHVFLYVDITDSEGRTKEYTIECNSVNLLMREGWKHNTLKPGDRVSLKFAPLRNGTAGGLLETITLPNGKQING